MAAILTLVAALWGGPLLTPDRTVAQAERVCAVSVISVVTGPGGGRNAGNPGVVLGGPEGTRAPFLSLGRGGTLVVLLGDDGASADGTPGSDLFVYESGTQAEFVFVAISTDGVTYVPVGSTGSQASGIDLDAAGFTPGTNYAYVQVQDDPNQGSHTGPETGGADIDAICGFNVGNASPVAGDDSATFAVGDDYVASVLTNDSDPDRNPLTVESFTQPDDGVGVVTFDDAGNATFVPTDPDFSGEVVFTYTIIDGQGGRATATVSFAIRGASPSPSASASASVSVSPSASVSASASASPSSSTSDSPSASASASSSVDESASASPSELASPSDSGTPDVSTSPSPSPLESASGDPTPSDVPAPSDEPGPSVEPSVAPSPDESLAPSPDASAAEPVPSESGAPVSDVVLFDGTVELPIDGERTADLAILIDNPAGLLISFATVAPPLNGEVVIDPAGTFSYVPFTGFGETDTFTFSVIVNGGLPAIAQVTVAVSADCSDGNVAEPQSGTPIAVDVAAIAQAELRPCAALARTGAGRIVSAGGAGPVSPAPVDPGSGNGGNSGDGNGTGTGAGTGAGPGGGGAGPVGDSAVQLPNTGVGTGASNQASTSLAAVILAITAALVIAAVVRRRLI